MGNTHDRHSCQFRGATSAFEDDELCLSFNQATQPFVPCGTDLSVLLERENSSKLEDLFGQGPTIDDVGVTPSKSAPGSARPPQTPVGSFDVLHERDECKHDLMELIRVYQGKTFVRIQALEGDLKAALEGDVADVDDDAHSIASTSAPLSPVLTGAKKRGVSTCCETDLESTSLGWQSSDGLGWQSSDELVAPDERQPTPDSNFTIEQVSSVVPEGSENHATECGQGDRCAEDVRTDLAEDSKISPRVPQDENLHSASTASADVEPDKFEIGDMVVLSSKCPPEYRNCQAIITQVAESHCTVAVLDPTRRFGIGECWPEFVDVELQSRALRIGARVAISGLKSPKMLHLNNLTGVVSRHPRQGHPTFIQKPSCDPRLTICVVFDDPAAAKERSALLEARFLIPYEEAACRMTGTLMQAVELLSPKASRAPDMEFQHVSVEESFGRLYSF